jgi:hypothetical protein
MKCKIVDNEDLVRDVETKAVLNTDLTSLDRYRMRREIEKNKQSEINQMKQEINEIKSMLHKLITEISK